MTGISQKIRTATTIIHYMFPILCKFDVHTWQFTETQPPCLMNAN